MNVASESATEPSTNAPSVSGRSDVPCAGADAGRFAVESDEAMRMPTIA